ncbi:hypothetical protein AAY473_031759 [Plecturocebus cupreus]
MSQAQPARPRGQNEPSRPKQNGQRGYWPQKFPAGRLLGRLRQENGLIPGAGGCSELRSCHYTRGNRARLVKKGKRKGEGKNFSTTVGWRPKAMKTKTKLKAVLQALCDLVLSPAHGSVLLTFP